MASGQPDSERRASQAVEKTVVVSWRTTTCCRPSCRGHSRVDHTSSSSAEATLRPRWEGLRDQVHAAVVSVRRLSVIVTGRPATASPTTGETTTSVFAQRPVGSGRAASAARRAARRWARRSARASAWAACSGVRAGRLRSASAGTAGEASAALVLAVLDLPGSEPPSPRPRTRAVLSTSTSATRRRRQ